MNRDYHDSVVYKIEYIDHHQLLIVGLKTSDGRILDLRFYTTIGWILSPFEIQNVLYDFKVYDYDSIPASAYDDFEISDAYTNILKSDKSYSIGIFNPSIGLGGFVIFKDLRETLVTMLPNDSNLR